MKKVKKIILFAIIFSLLLIIIVIGSRAIKKGMTILFFHNVSMWAHSADWNNYKSDFIIVKDYVRERYSSEDKKSLLVSNTKEHGLTLYDIDTKEYMDDIPNEVRESLESINSHGFPDKGSVLDYIDINGDMVSFCIENGRYALVYSHEEKPTRLSSINEAKDIKVKKCAEDWYHVIVNPN